MELELIEHASKYPPQQYVKVGDNVEEIVLGRHPDNAVCIKSVSISRRHAVLKKTSCGYEIQEQKAVNRVYVNGVLLPHGATKTLANHDQVQLGVKPDPSEPATHNSEYFLYKLMFSSTRKRALSPPSPNCTKQAKTTETSALLDTPQNDAGNNTESTAGEKEEAIARAAQAKADKEKAELRKQLENLREQQDAQEAKEEALRQEMLELKSLQAKKAEELAKKFEDKEKEFKEVTDAQARVSLEMTKKLEERDQELEQAKIHKQKLEALEDELRLTKAEQDRLSSTSAKIAVQEKITDLLEEQLQCTICSELMIKPKNFPCSHAYCGYCIDKWLLKKKECPICRSKVTAATTNYLLSNLIEKAVEELSEESKVYRNSIIKTREDEVAKKTQPSGKGKKKARVGNNNPPASATTGATINLINNPSTSQSPSSNHTAARASTPSASSSGQQSSTEEVIDLTSDSEFENLGNSGSASSSSSADGHSNNPTDRALSSTLDSSSDSNTESDSEEESYYGGYRRAWDMSRHDVYDTTLSSSSDDLDLEYTGLPGGVYEGYGACFNCGDPGHWRPNCPHR